MTPLFLDVSLLRQHKVICRAAEKVLDTIGAWQPLVVPISISNASFPQSGDTYGCFIYLGERQQSGKDSTDEMKPTGLWGRIAVGVREESSKHRVEAG